MSRLSLWKDGRHTNDYKFFDRRISEMFTIGGTGILCHKYLGTNPQGLQLTTNAAQSPSALTILNFADTSNINLGDLVTGTGIPANTTVTAKTATTITLSNPAGSALATGTSIGISPDAAKPAYTNQSALNIQDLLWQENRDRKYDSSVYKMRGIYQKQDQDFDLSQFGLFLQTGTIFMTFHLRDMVDLIGRKLMSGDVLELEHLKDFDALNQDVPAALKRYYVVSDASWPAEGFTPTWWPHLWRVKLNPLIDSQEYKDILNQIVDGTSTPLSQLISTYNTNIAINDAIIKEAEQNVPKSGYDTTSLYDTPIDDSDRDNDNDYDIINSFNTTADETVASSDETKDTADEQPPSPTRPIPVYLSGDAQAPNGLPMGAGIQFPTNPSAGDFFLRTDYMPNRVFRWDGARWAKFNDVERTGLTQGPNNQTLIGTFVNNTNTWTTIGNTTIPERQSLSTALKPKADN